MSHRHPSHRYLRVLSLLVNIATSHWSAFYTLRCLANASCGDAFQLNSQCYRVHKNERVNWFTAVNRCQSNNGRLAVFDDDVRQYFPSSLMAEQAWIGLVKPWWAWPSMGMCHWKHFIICIDSFVSCSPDGATNLLTLFFNLLTHAVITLYC